MPSSLPFGKAGDLQILRCQGFAVVHYSITLFASSLKTSDFCNVRVILECIKLIELRFLKIRSPEDFVLSTEGVTILDSISMRSKKSQILSVDGL